MKISRSVYDEMGSHRNEEKVLTINIKPGWKAGTKVKISDSCARNKDNVLRLRLSGRCFLLVVNRKITVFG